MMKRHSTMNMSMEIDIVSGNLKGRIYKHPYRSVTYTGIEPSASYGALKSEGNSEST